MPHASALSPLSLPLPLLPPFRALGRGLGAAGQAAGFALLLWLVVATPGLVTDGASTVPVEAQAP